MTKHSCRYYPKIISSLVLAALSGWASFVGVRQVGAIAYNSSTSSDWCNSTLRSMLNATAYLNLYEEEQNYLKTYTDDGCNNSVTTKVRIFTKDEWNTVNTMSVSGSDKTYKTVVGGGSTYLPTGITNAWTRTAKDSTTVYYNNATGGINDTNAVSPTTSSGYEAIPVIELDLDNLDLCIADDSKAGTLSDPYTLTTSGCNHDPEITITTTGNKIMPANQDSTRGSLTISGKVVDPDVGQKVTITATLGGKQGSWSQTVPSGGLNTTWSITWYYDDVNETTVAANGLVFTATDNSAHPHDITANYTGQIIIDKTPPVCGTDWTPTEANQTWHASGTQVFTIYKKLSSSSHPNGFYDNGGSGLTSAMTDTLTCETGSNNGDKCTVKLTDNAGNYSNCESPRGNKVDGETPTPVCTVSGITAGQSWKPDENSTTVYYNSTKTGSFTVTATVSSAVTGGSAPRSGITKITFPKVSDNWTAPTAVTDDTSSPYSQVYTWKVGTSSQNVDNQVIAYYGDSTSAKCTFRAISDGAAPGEGSDQQSGALGYTTHYVNDLNNSDGVALTVTVPEDKISGLDSTTWQLYRVSASLGNSGECGTFPAFTDADSQKSTFTNVNNVFTATEGFANNTCYKYRLTVSDHVGNKATIDTDQVIKVSTDQPSITFVTTGDVKSGETTSTGNAAFSYFDGTSKMFYKPASTSTVQVAVSASDPISLIKQVNFPASNVSGITRQTSQPVSSATTGNIYTSSYQIASSANTTSASNLSVVATNNANNNNSANFIFEADSTPPTTSSVTITCGSADPYITNESSFTITGTKGSDGSGAGIDDTRTYIEMAQGGIQSGNKCLEGQSTLAGLTYARAGEAGSQTYTRTTSANEEQCYYFRFRSTDRVGNVTLSDVCTVMVDRKAPVCGTWQPASVDWKDGLVSETVPKAESELRQVFTMSDASDTGSGLESTSYSCTAAGTDGAQCERADTLIKDTAGNQTYCDSNLPTNRVDTAYPTLTVDPALDGWQETMQNINVAASDTQSGLAYIAYQWDTPFTGWDTTAGPTCASSEGNQISPTGTNLRSTITEGSHVLYVCARDGIGHVSKFTDTYQYSQKLVEEDVEVVDNVPAGFLTWNTRLLTSGESIVIEGEISATGVPKQYNIDFQFKDDSDEDRIHASVYPLTTSTTAATPFTITVPYSKFNASTDKFTFEGPHQLILTEVFADGTTGTELPIDYNVNFYFPTYNVRHRVNSGIFIHATDYRVNEL